MDKGSESSAAAPPWTSTALRAGIAGIPFVGSSLEVLVTDTIARRQARVTETGASARDFVGDDETFVARLKADERLSVMLVEASETACGTRLRAKRIAMGRVVGQAIRDDALIEESQLLFLALRDLDAPHFRLLAEIEGVEDIEEFGLVQEPMRSALMRHGVVESVVNYGGGIVVAGVSDFGRRLLAFVEEAESEPDGAVAPRWPG